MANRPNRHVRHKDGWEVDMYFSPTLQEELADRDREVRDDARRAVCTRFRKVCEKKYGNKWMGAWVNWSDLKITKIERSPRSAGSTKRTQPSPPSAENPNCKCDTQYRCPVHDA